MFSLVACLGSFWVPRCVEHTLFLVWEINTRENTFVFGMMWMFLGGPYSGHSCVSRGSCLWVPWASTRSDPSLWWFTHHWKTEFGVEIVAFIHVQKKVYNVKSVWKLIGFFSNFHQFLQLARTKWCILSLFFMPLSRPSLLCISLCSETGTAVHGSLCLSNNLTWHYLVEFSLPRAWSPSWHSGFLLWYKYNAFL